MPIAAAIDVSKVKVAFTSPDDSHHGAIMANGATTVTVQLINQSLLDLAEASIRAQGISIYAGETKLCDGANPQGGWSITVPNSQVQFGAVQARSTSSSFSIYVSAPVASIGSQVSFRINPDMLTYNVLHNTGGSFTSESWTVRPSS